MSVVIVIVMCSTKVELFTEHTLILLARDYIRYVIMLV